MPKPTKSNQGLKFIGQRGPDGKPVEFIGWAPARDLTAEEVQEMGPDNVEALIASRLYAWETSSAGVSYMLADDEGKVE